MLCLYNTHLFINVFYYISNKVIQNILNTVSNKRIFKGAGFLFNPQVKPSNYSLNMTVTEVLLSLSHKSQLFITK